MNIAGLDLATASGFAVWKDVVTGTAITTTTFKAPTKKKNILEGSKALDAVHEGNVGKTFEDALRVWLIDNKVEYVAIEAPIPSNNKRRERVVSPDADFAGQAITYIEKDGTSLAAIYRLYGLSFMACQVCNRLNIPTVLVAQQTWRKAFLGHGHPKDAKKEAVKMCRRLGIDISSVDCAEAVGVVHWLKGHLFPYSHAANSLFNLPPTTKVPAPTAT
ncbi:hypothetical protein MesoLjLc_51580 [Mesorhizobium sp. L-8-10]|uniref:hypothetical protein n=1 Tax=Mesorhizobium sp. L-8-10 TaxID=2744523 RepID=UPI001929021F|nr:hypothetical protein [Mesorhizobium sp. L-8-10]BCH33228.1 hypothetical protein MesoLjLc_51580 [Mesorhizobium sp. L-8-10]